MHFVVPDGIDDPARPSGGNTYDRRICRGLRTLGWSIHEHAAPTSWPRADRGARAALADVLRRIPDDSVVLLDGLIAAPAPDALVPESRRLRLVALVHMPLGHRPVDAESRVRERAVLAAAAAVITTSAWTRGRLLELYPLSASEVHVAEPGVDWAPLASGTATGRSLLCVAAVTFDKGYDVLLDALATLRELSWRCLCVGSLDRDPGFVGELVRGMPAHGLDDRVELAGTQTRTELERSYAAADLVVLASRAETYGMVITEALARGLPVVATDVGGVPEALGHGTEGVRPGLLVPPEDPAALAAALRAWITDAELRRRLRAAARQRRDSLPGWRSTAAVIASVLAGTSR